VKTSGFFICVKNSVDNILITTEEVHAFSMMCKRITSLYAEKQTSVGIGTGDEKLKRTAEKHRRRIAENGCMWTLFPGNSGRAVRKNVREV
jgi:hypothetical protein